MGGPVQSKPDDSTVRVTQSGDVLISPDGIDSRSERTEERHDGTTTSHVEDAHYGSMEAEVEKMLSKYPDEVLEEHKDEVDDLREQAAGKYVVTGHRDQHEASTKVDGTRVHTYRSSGTGSYGLPIDPRTGLPPIDMKTGLEQPKVVERVTITERDGASKTSDSEAERSVPGSVDELMRAQDELSGALNGLDPNLPPAHEGASASDVLRLARNMAKGIDARNLNEAVVAGARRIGASDPGAIEDMGEQAFDETRAKLDDIGITGGDGNEEIDRHWLERSVVDNAYYDHEGDQMVFGAGSDGTPFAVADDIVAHEFTHRIQSRNGNPAYEDESGAINESLSDTMAAAVDEDWVVGEDAIVDGIRDMRTKVTIDDYVDTGEFDHGGVHSNSAIPNHAAYLIGSKVGREDMARIYGKVIDEELTADISIRELAYATYDSAVSLYGAGSAQASAVDQAWQSVLVNKRWRNPGPQPIPGGRGRMNPGMV